MKTQLAIYLSLISVFSLLLLNCISAKVRGWQLDFELAKQKAKKYNKTLVMVFQGSDWCDHSMKLKRQILNSEEFKIYADENLIMLKVDFPKRRKNTLSPEQQSHNNALADKYNQQGYLPYMVITDYEGRVLGNLGYQSQTPKAYIESLQTILMPKTLS